MKFKTEQEEFWAGEFGENYIHRNIGEEYLNAKIVFFSNILRRAPQVDSIMELGCNVGLNLQALNRINSNFKLYGYEINKIAAQKARDLKIAKIIDGSILEPIDRKNQFDICFTNAVLIHINPDYLNAVYENLYNLSKRYIIISEYYSPFPVSINYREAQDKLFKRDFAGDLIDKYGLKLVDYGFEYHRDNYFPQDDFNWFLLEK